MQILPPQVLLLLGLTEGTYGVTSFSKRDQSASAGEQEVMPSAGTITSVGADSQPIRYRSRYQTIRPPVGSICPECNCLLPSNRDRWPSGNHGTPAEHVSRRQLPSRPQHAVRQSDCSGRSLDNQLPGGDILWRGELDRSDLHQLGLLQRRSICEAWW